MSWSKESSTKRGYGYKWQQLRLAALKRDKGLCQPCRRAGRVTLATAVDHIMPKAECRRLRIPSDYMNNLQGICKDCHDKKTMKENGGEPIKATGLDGWPV